MTTKRKNEAENNLPAVYISTLFFVILVIVPIYLHPEIVTTILPWTKTNSSTDPSHPSVVTTTASIRLRPKDCDLFRGEWVPNPRAPYYTNDTCWAIHDHQNCAKYGRPDMGFLKWRWQPDGGCELPIFNPAIFLNLVRGKKLAFLGDSVARNQMQSLMCLLSRVTYPIHISKTTDVRFVRWFYPDYDFTVASYWSPYLVRAYEADPGGPSLTGLFNLYLDEPDTKWTTEIAEYDYVVVSAGHWFFRATMYHEKGKLVGCHYCMNNTIDDKTIYYGYRRAFRTTFKFLNSLEGYKGTTILRSFMPAHFEGGEWDKGGDCKRTRPFRGNEIRLDGFNLEMYLSQVEEYRAAEKVAAEKGLRYRLLDVTEPMMLRPDGHPSRFGHPANANVTLKNDCVHWCLPGPIDNVNDFLLEILKRDRMRELVTKQ